MGMAATGDDTLSSTLRDYGIVWTLLRAKDPRVALMDTNAEWKRLYQDENAVIHVPVLPSN